MIQVAADETSTGFAFTDVDPGAVHCRAIDSLWWQGVVKGTSPDAFSPDAAVTRAEMASFLARAWEAVGNTCPQSSPPFDDVDAESTHADSISCIATWTSPPGPATVPTHQTRR